MRRSATLPVAAAWMLTLLAGASLRAQEPERRYEEPPTRAQLEPHMWMVEEMVPALLDSGEVTGLSMAFVVEAKVARTRGFGRRNAGSRERVDENTVFEAASLTKPVVAYAILRLVEEGVLELDRPLSEYMAYADIADDPRAQGITARMVLSHTTGFPNWRRDEPLATRFEPGTQFGYSGEGFVYLAKVVELLTDEPLHELVQRLVIEPLGMTRSSLVWESRFKSNYATGHRDNGEPYEKQRPESANAAASLHTTATDFARFVAAVMRSELLEKGTVNEMLTPQIEVEGAVSWGLGWGLEGRGDGLAFWHWGHNDGFRAFVIADPRMQLGMVVFTNSDNGMSIMGTLLAAAAGADQPAFEWLDYESFNSPRRVVRRRLEEKLRDAGVQAMISEYHALKRHYPEDAFNEGLLNALGYRLLGRERFADAIEVFKLNVDEYPEAFNPYDSLGEAYMKQGEIDLAIENYQRSVELNPDNSNGHAMLEKLRAERAERD
ncbi:MAG: serine hydrolase [Candidatus Latescibacterota bacterium]|nr:MAG: serine hydrolase [Candidatus Latescibacterota bacterium]